MAKKIDLMHREFGRCEGHTCRECCNLIRVNTGKRTVVKCCVYGNTASTASDWAGRYLACGMFNKQWGKAPVMLLSRKSDSAAPDTEPLEGQLSLEV